MNDERSVAEDVAAAGVPPAHEGPPMTELERIRHSCAHVMATAILRLWPEAQFAAGPPVENGFYYDVDLPHRISPEDFAKIEEEMKKEIKANNVFEKIDRHARTGASRLAQSGRLGGSASDPATPSKFKLDNHRRHSRGRSRSRSFKNGDFIDLCAGPHVMRTGNIGAFKLTTWPAPTTRATRRTRSSSASTARRSRTRPQLDEYFTMLEEAKKRDHRKIGAEMGLFALRHRIVGPGLPLWLPKGTAHRRGTGEAGEGNGVRRRLRAREDAAPRAGEHVSNQRASAVLRGVDVSADGVATKACAEASCRRRLTNRRMNWRGRCLAEAFRKTAGRFAQRVRQDAIRRNDRRCAPMNFEELARQHSTSRNRWRRLLKACGICAAIATTSKP